jgi:hypothetical protein
VAPDPFQPGCKFWPRYFVATHLEVICSVQGDALADPRGLKLIRRHEAVNDWDALKLVKPRDALTGRVADMPPHYMVWNRNPAALEVDPIVVVGSHLIFDWVAVAVVTALQATAVVTLLNQALCCSVR